MDNLKNEVAACKNSPELTLSIVLSFFNEEMVLTELIRKLREVLNNESKKGTIDKYELIFVNDDSTDRSETILLEAAKDGFNDIRIITMSRNFGVSECVLAGMEYASGDAVIYMDADLQDPPEVIPDMIQAWRSGDNIDVVHTRRLSREGESRFKLWVTHSGYNMLRHVANIDLQMETGDFKLLSRRAVNHLVELKEKKPFLRGLVCWIGFNQTIIKYHRKARFAGKTKFPIISIKVLRNFLSSALISFSDVPLQLSLISGFIISFSAFLFLFFVIFQKLLGHPTQGWSATMAAILLLGGMQLVTIGVLGLYINSIYLEVKRRPNYIIKKMFGFENAPVFVCGAYKGFNITTDGYKFYALFKEEGPFDIKKFNVGEYERCFSGESFSAVKHLIDDKA